MVIQRGQIHFSPSFRPKLYSKKQCRLWLTRKQKWLSTYLYTIYSTCEIQIKTFRWKGSAKNYKALHTYIIIAATTTVAVIHANGSCLQGTYKLYLSRPSLLAAHRFWWMYGQWYHFICVGENMRTDVDKYGHHWVLTLFFLTVNWVVF